MRSRFSMRFKHPRIIALLAGIIFILVGVELLLRLFDPTGAGRYAADQFILGQNFTLEPRDYSLPPGTYQFSTWSATINSDRSRFVPDTPIKASRKLIFIGDSATFSFGVNDEDTWINLLAKDYHDVQMINTGVVGYNIAEVLASIDLYPGDDYLWLTIPNDLDDPISSFHSTQPFVSYISVYWRIAVQRSASDALPGENEATYEMRVRGTKHYENLLQTALDTYGSKLTVVAFDDEFGQWVANRFGATLIPWYRNVISAADKHANVAGNREIAAAMQPIVRQIIDGISQKD